VPKRFSTIQKCAFWFAALFLSVYSLDYIPGIMDKNGLMFGLFHMSKMIDFGHLVLGALALVSALISEKAARIYFWFLGIWYTVDVVTYFVGHLRTVSLTNNILVNLPHTIIFIAAYWIAMNVSKRQPERVAA
jgi:uncharacterized protein DUF4383